MLNDILPAEDISFTVPEAIVATEVNVVPTEVVAPIEPPTTYSIVGDNLDKTIRPRYMRVGSGNRLFHYFHHIAIADRIDVSNLSITPPAPPRISHKKCAMSLLLDDQALKRNMITLVSRILVNHVEPYQFAFSDVVDWHIPQDYQAEMSKETEVVRIKTFKLLHACLLIKGTGDPYQK